MSLNAISVVPEKPFLTDFRLYCSVQNREEPLGHNGRTGVEGFDHGLEVL